MRGPGTTVTAATTACSAPARVGCGATGPILVSLLLSLALLLPIAGPLVDVTYAARQPHHDHLYFGRAGLHHSHAGVDAAGQRYGRRQLTSLETAVEEGIVVSILATAGRHGSAGPMLFDGEPPIFLPPPPASYRWRTAERVPKLRVPVAPAPDHPPRDFA